MPLHTVPRKTAAAHQLLKDSRQALTPGLRMLLITIDGRKTVADLTVVARGLGLDGAAFDHLRAEGLIAWDEPVPATAPVEKPQLRRLVQAKFFAMDLAARMLAGQDQALRERSRDVVTETGFHRWLDECAEAIERAGGEDRASLFRERVTAAT